MCQSAEDSGIVQVRVNTDRAKYEFLRSFYTLWNFITKASPRVIIDTHAGSGIVNLHGKKDITGKKQEKLIYGSPLLAIIKTVKISKNLKIILNEKNPIVYETLDSIVKEMIQKGVPVFEEIKEPYKYKSMETNRKRKLKQNISQQFPDIPDAACPTGYKKKQIKTKAEICLYNKDIKDIIDEILESPLQVIEEKKQFKKPIALFLVDPCGMVSWNKIVKKICERANKKQGTDMILNWSWEAIARTMTTENKNSVLSKIYGIPREKISEEFEYINTMEQFLSKYIQQLRQYFEFVELQGVPKERKLKPKLSKFNKYFLILCTNNPSALSIAGHKKKKIMKSFRNGYKDIAEYLK